MARNNPDLSASVEPALLQNTPQAPLQVVPRKNIGQLCFAPIVGSAFLLVAYSFVTNEAWEWDVVFRYFTEETVLTGLLMTLELTAICGGLGFLGGTMLALMKLSKSQVLRLSADLYIWIFRSVPLMLQLVLWYNISYLYPAIAFSLPLVDLSVYLDTRDILDKFGAAVLGLSLYQAAYCAEIVRAGILTVDKGQMEAAAAMGMPHSRQYLRIVFPQALRSIVPNAINEIIGLLKGTSIVSILGLGELFHIVRIIYGRTQQILPMLMVAALWYLVVTTLITLIQRAIERRLNRAAIAATSAPTLKEDRLPLLSRFVPRQL
ncbi:amino acid ABC transporter permease [Pseudochelatococcus sp. B33]